MVEAQAGEVGVERLIGHAPARLVVNGTVIKPVLTHIGDAVSACAEGVALADDGLLAEEQGEVVVIKEIDSVLSGVGEGKLIVA